jgi:hypothetical protein
MRLTIHLTARWTACQAIQWNVATPREGDGFPHLLEEVATRFVGDVAGDGYGNACDPDLDNNGGVGVSDFIIISQLWGRTDALADLNGDGVGGTPDWDIFVPYWGGAPGPSGLDCAGSGELCTGP